MSDIKITKWKGAEMDCEHNTHGECCWCNPTIEVMPNGNKVIIHNNNISPEEAAMTREILASSDSTAELLREVRKARKITILEIAKKNRNKPQHNFRNFEWQSN